LRQCQPILDDIDFLRKGILWPQLAELNLAGVDWKPIPVADLATIPIHENLVSLVVSEDCVSIRQRNVMNAFFGDRIHWAAPREQFGLGR
jgi:hypothetical protein